MLAARTPYRHPWLDHLASDPAEAVDEVLLGVAPLPGLQRASPCEALMALMGDLPDDAPEWEALDHHLCLWLRRRRAETDDLLDRPGGLHRFVRETGEALRTAWRLSLPESSAWLRANLHDLLRWADALSSGATFDLGRAVLAAGAHLQEGRELRFLWLRVCDEAAGPRLRHRLDTALLGLSRMPGGQAGGPPPDLITGLARWASRLPKDEQRKSEVVREWRALKAAFPRLPGSWRERWEAILEDGRYDHPFIGWLKDADPALKAPAKGKQVRRTPTLPHDITGTIRDMEQACQQDGLTEPLWLRMRALLDRIEHYADVTGAGCHLVTSCTNIASIILPHAPGQALTLARRALLWSPSDGHAWSVRARALDRLGRSDLATAVLWEGIRRLPSHSVFYTELALKLTDRGLSAEAERLLRKATAIDGHGAPFVELARLLWSTGRADDAIELLRAFIGRKTNQVALYTLGGLLVAEGRFADAALVLATYRRLHGDDRRSVVLDRAIAADEAGREEMRRHLRTERHRESADAGVSWDAGAAAALAGEGADAGRLSRLGAITEADLRIQLGGFVREEALRRVDAALAADPSDGYAQLVKLLSVPEHRLALAGRAGRFTGSLPLQLALTPPGAAPDRWRDLAERFPDGRPLIGLVRLARLEADDGVREGLGSWSATPSNWDETWTAFLKDQVGRHLREDGAPAIALPDLAHDALIQAVDVGWDAGWDATPKAA